MRFVEFRDVEKAIFESNRGVLGAVLDNQGGGGDIFVTPDGIEYAPVNGYKFPTQQGVKRYEPIQDDETPSEENGSTTGPAIKTPDEQFETELNEILKINPNNITWCGGQKPSTGWAALIVELQSSQNIIYVGKYFKTKDASDHIFWQMSKFTADCTAAGINISLKPNAKRTGTVGSVAMFPTNLKIEGSRIPVDAVGNTLRSQMANFDKVPEEEKETIVQLIENLGKGSVPINPKLKANYEVQLGETAAPVALQRGFGVSGNYQDAQEKLLNVLEPGLTWAKMNSVEFPQDVAEKLIDSYMYSAKGTKISVSSKDKNGGAPASIKSIIETIDAKRAQIVDRVPDFETRFKDYLRYLDIINQSSGKNMVLNLAVDLGMVNEDVARKFADVAAKEPNNVEALRSVDGTGKFYSMCINYDGYKPKDLSHSMYAPGYHAIASLSRMVCNRMNEPQSEVYAFFSTVLESSNMIQVKTAFKASGDQGEFNGFQVIYPPVFDGLILFDPGSYYYATAKPGVLTFKFFPGKRPAS